MQFSIWKSQIRTVVAGALTRRGHWLGGCAGVGALANAGDMGDPPGLSSSSVASLYCARVSSLDRLVLLFHSPCM